MQCFVYVFIYDKADICSVLFMCSYMTRQTYAVSAWHCHTVAPHVAAPTHMHTHKHTHMHTCIHTHFCSFKPFQWIPGNPICSFKPFQWIPNICSHLLIQTSAHLNFCFIQTSAHSNRFNESQTITGEAEEAVLSERDIVGPLYEIMRAADFEVGCECMHLCVCVFVCVCAYMYTLQSVVFFPKEEKLTKQEWGTAP